MDNDTPRALIGITAAVVIGALVAWAGSDGSAQMGTIPVFAICGLLAFAVNWIAFIPSNAAKTEKYYDLTGSVTYLYLPLIPDLALCRDHPGMAPWRRRLYGWLALGWTGEFEQWRHYTRGYLFFAALATPLVISVHSVVSWDFALGVVPAELAPEVAS